MRYSPYTTFIKSETYTWFAGVRSGERYRVLSSFARMLDDAINAGESYDSFLDSFEDKSRDYCKTKLDYLVQKKFVLNNSNDFEIPQKLKITLSLSRRCNLHCKHCCVSASASADELDNDDYQKIVDKIISLHPDILVITGGEPLLRNNFKQIVDSFKLANITLCLMTNGTLINANNVKYLTSTFDSIDISIDGYDEDSCALIRGKNTFSKVIYGIELLQKEGFYAITGSFVVTKTTAKDKGKFLSLCEEMKIKPIVRGFAPVGRGMDYQDDLTVPSRFDDSDEISKAMTGIQQQEGRLTPDNCDLFVCDGAFSSYYIEYNGNIYPCPSFSEEEYKIGNIQIIDDLNAFFIKRTFTSESAYQRFFSYFPHKLAECKDCVCNLLCFRCARELKEHSDSPSSNRCRVNKYGFEECLHIYEENIKK